MKRFLLTVSVVACVSFFLANAALAQCNGRNCSRLSGVVQSTNWAPAYQQMSWNSTQTMSVAPIVSWNSIQAIPVAPSAFYGTSVVKESPIISVPTVTVQASSKPIQSMDTLVLLNL